jgi:hypothetical protein
LERVTPVDPDKNGMFVVADHLRPFVAEGVSRDDAMQLLRQMVSKASAPPCPPRPALAHD